MNPYRQPAVLPSPPSFRLTPAARRWVRIRQWACEKIGHNDRAYHWNRLPVCPRCGKPLSNSSVETVKIRRALDRQTTELQRIAHEWRAIRDSGNYGPSMVAAIDAHARYLDSINIPTINVELPPIPDFKIPEPWVSKRK